MLSRTALAAVRRQEIEVRSDWHDTGGIDQRVALIIVPLDMSEIDRLGDARMLVKLTGETPKIGVVQDPSQIAFEMSDVDSVKSHQGRE
jgi:hypothetical protein